MNSASSTDKLEAVVAVINESVRQRRVMHTKMAKLDTAMMKHMMEHMAGNKQMMKMCPMMKGL